MTFFFEIVSHNLALVGQVGLTLIGLLPTSASSLWSAGIKACTTSTGNMTKDHDCLQFSFPPSSEK